MSKGLEALKQMSAYHLEMGVAIRDLPNYEIIEKELQALEIMNDRCVDVIYVKRCKTYKEYCKYYSNLFEEEYDLLREVLV